jgi:hypothetical protein
LMQYCCLSFSVIFAENNNATCAAYTLVTHLAGCTLLTLSAGGKKSTYACEGPLHLPSNSTPPYHSTPPLLHQFPWTKIMSDAFWAGHVCDMLCVWPWCLLLSTFCIVYSFFIFVVIFCLYLHILWCLAEVNETLKTYVISV